MSNVIPFRRASTQSVKLWFGWIEETVGSGDLSQLTYFVEVEGGSSSDEVVWEGETYEEALRVAAAVAADAGGLPIIDEVAA